MKGKISTIKNANGEVAFPITTISAVYMEDGTTKLSEEVEELKNELDNVEDSATKLSEEVEELKNELDNMEDGTTKLSEEVEGLKNELDNMEQQLQEEINEVFQCVSNAKKIIAEAITDKGVETSATDTFQTMTDNINKINANSKGFEYIGNTSGLKVLNIHEFINDMSGEEI